MQARVRFCVNRRTELAPSDCAVTRTVIRFTIERVHLHLWTPGAKRGARVRAEAGRFSAQ